MMVLTALAYRRWPENPPTTLKEASDRAETKEQHEAVCEMISTIILAITLKRTGGIPEEVIKVAESEEGKALFRQLWVKHKRLALKEGK